VNGGPGQPGGPRGRPPAGRPIIPLTPADPRRLGSYELVGRLGRGGMGTVYLGRGTGDRLVAVKVIRPEYAELPEFRAQFRREADLARRVARFCTAEVIEVGDGEQPYLVTEYVAGPTLSQAVARGGPLRSGDLEQVATGVAVALTAIHRAGLVHRDLKPSNVLLCDLGPRVIDFGIARAAEATTTLNGPLRSVGTPAFMAPEQAGGGAPVTTAADIFAWGGLVAFAGTGRLPFGDGTTPAQLYRVVHHSPSLDGLDATLLPLVTDAMSKDPARRPTADDLVARLVGLGGRAPALGAPPPPRALPPAPEPDTPPALDTPPGLDTVVLRPLPLPAPLGDRSPDPETSPPPSEPAPRYRWARRPGRRGIAGVVAALVAAVTVSLLALPRAGGPAPGTVAASVAATARRLRPGDPALAGRLSLAAFRISPGRASTESMISSFAAPLSRAVIGHSRSVLGVAASPNGRLAATSSADRTIKVWDISAAGAPVPLATLTGFRGWVPGVMFSPDGRLLAGAGLDGMIRLWDVTRPARPRLLAAFSADTHGVRHLAFSPDSRLLASADRDNTAQLWDVSTPERPTRLAILPGHTGVVEDVAFSPDARTVAVASTDDTVALWDVSRVRAPAPLAVLSGHTNFVWTVAFRPDGRVLATGSYDGAVDLWDVSDPHRPRRLSVITADRHNVYEVTFSPDGRTLVTAGDDTQPHLWDVTDPAHPRLGVTLVQPDRLVAAVGHLDWVQGISLAGGGTKLLTVYDDTSLREWDLAPARLASEACRSATYRITRAEWARFIPALPYRPVC
jgi:serine/threonine protein kinase